MSKRFVVVHEAEADFHTATELADQVLNNSLGERLTNDQWKWIGTVSGERLTWSGIKRLAGEIGIKAHGHFDGEPGKPDAAAARRAILYIKKVLADVNAIVLVRDRDDQPERRRGLEQARNQCHGKTVIVIGLAVVEREAWVISGFDPLDEEEKSRLDAERQNLGFNPCEQSHELDACKNDQAKRSPKRVLRQLSAGDWDRERHCWKETPIEQLQERGGGNGLAAYLQEVRERLSPLIQNVS